MKCSTANTSSTDAYLIGDLAVGAAYVNNDNSMQRYKYESTIYTNRPVDLNGYDGTGGDAGGGCCADLCECFSSICNCISELFKCCCACDLNGIM